MSINRVIISGNLTRDAELGATQDGTAVLRMGVAVNDRRRNQSGEWEDVPNFVDVTVWGRRAEALAQYMLKGTKVCVEGRLHYSSWEDRNTGSKRSKLEVYADEVEFMSRQGQQTAQRGAYKPDAGANPMDDLYGADIPF